MKLKQIGSLPPPAISVIATTSEKQDNHNDNQDRCHSFLQIYNGRFSLFHVGLKSLRHQPRNLPSAAGATVSLDRPAPAMANPAGKYAGVSMPPPDASQHGAGRKTDPNADPDALPVLAARIARYRALRDRRTRGCPAGSDRADHRPPTTIRAARSAAPASFPIPPRRSPSPRSAGPAANSLCQHAGRPGTRKRAGNIRRSLGSSLRRCAVISASTSARVKLTISRRWRRSTHLLQPVG